MNRRFESRLLQWPLTFFSIIIAASTLHSSDHCWSADRGGLAAFGLHHDADRMKIPVLAERGQFIHDEGLFSVAITPDGQVMATGGESSLVYLWDVKTRQIAKTLDGHEGNVVGLEIDLHGQRLASLAFDGIRIWRLSSGRLEHHLPVKRGSTTWVRFAPDGQSLASGGMGTDVPLQIWDVISGDQRDLFHGNLCDTTCAAYSPDGQKLAVGHRRLIDFGEVSIWDLGDCRELARFSTNRHDVRGIEYTPDGTGIIVAAVSGELALWDAESGGRAVQQFPVQGWDITALAVSPDGSFLATSSRSDRAIHLWELATGEEIARFTGHESIVKRIAFAANGSVAVSGGFDGVAKLWSPLIDVHNPLGQNGQFSPDDTEMLWKLMTHGNAAAANEAAATLRFDPNTAIKLIEARVRPLSPSRHRLIKDSIDRLSDANVNDRQQAMDDLIREGDPATIALRRARSGGGSILLKQRIAFVLGAIQQRPNSSETVATIRAIRLLEQIGNGGAQSVLERFAQGENDDRCAVSARSALARIRKVSAPTHLDIESRPSVLSDRQGVESSIVSTLNPDLPSTPKSDGVLMAPDSDAMALAAEIDRLIESRLVAAHVQPAPMADDAEWLRRIRLDLTGKIPVAFEVRDLIDDSRPDKRQRLIKKLLLDPEYLSHQVNIWRAFMIVPRKPGDLYLRSFELQPALERWLRDCLRQNLGYDAMIRTLLTTKLPEEQKDASRSESMIHGMHPLAFYFRQPEVTPAALASDWSRLFLGVRLDCARCHDHPFDSWTRKQFWEFAAFFSGIRAEDASLGRAIFRGEDPDLDCLTIPETDTVVKARFLDNQEPQRREGTSTRQLLAEWITADDNPYFARAAVNRVWSEFFGAGLVEPVDDIQFTTSNSNRELLDLLGRHFKAKKFDLRFLTRAILYSRCYQRTSRLSDDGQLAAQMLAKMPVRRLTQEQIYDSLIQASGYGQTLLKLCPDESSFYGTNTRSAFVRRVQDTGPRTQTELSMLDALFLMNGPFLERLMEPRREETLHDLVQDGRTSSRQQIDELFLVTLSRRATTDELTRMTDYIQRRSDDVGVRKAVAELFWALVNSAEFLSNH